MRVSLRRVLTLIGKPLASVRLISATHDASQRAAWSCGCVAHGTDGGYDWTPCGVHTAAANDASALYLREMENAMWAREAVAP